MEADLTFFLLALFVGEQAVMIKLGSYPYSLGLPIAHKKLPGDLQIEDLGGFIGRFRTKRDEEGNIFFRYKHFPLTWGPYVFVGQAKKEDPNELIIRIGPLTCLVFLIYLVQGILAGFISTIFSFGIVGVLLWYFFKCFARGYEEMVRRTNKI